MSNNRNQNSQKFERIIATANRFAHQTGATFVQVNEKRADFEAREKVVASSQKR